METGVLSDQERLSATSALREAFQEFEDLTAGMPETAWRQKATPQEWSPLEVLEHLIFLERRVCTFIIPKLLQSEAVPREIDREKEKLMAETVARGDQKIQAPLPAQPTGACADWNVSCAEFRGLREETIAYVTSTGDALRTHQLAHPLFGLLDGYQWISLLAAHHHRHNKQLARVIAG